ncbi:MAG: GNAT family N-acetyltransferase, partial [Betaproteobacteria bacterium]
MAMMSDTLRIGYARPADAEPMALLSRDAIEHGLGWEYRAERIQRYLKDADAVVLVARERSDFAGFAIMQFGDERAHLVLLAVAPTFRRRGTGRRLLGWLVESAQVAGLMSVHVELRAHNHAAHALYRTAGFAESMRIPGYYRGRETAVRML